MYVYICICVYMYAIKYVLVYACMPWPTESYDMLAIPFALMFLTLFSCMILCLKGQSPPQTQSPTRRTSSAKRTRHKTRSTRQTLMSSASWVAPHQRHNWESCLNHKSVSCPVQIKFLDLRRRGFKTQPQKTFQTFKNIKNLL